jgi:hypothetical protein
MTGSENPAPLFSFRGLPLALFLSILMCWPMFVSGGLYVSEDTSSYLRGGEIIVSTLKDIYGRASNRTDAAAQPSVESLKVGVTGRSTVGRSFIYSAFSYLAMSLSGPIGIALAQGTMIVFAIFALISKAALQSPRTLIAGGVLIVGLTTLPWYTVYLMPDIFGSIIIVFGAVMVGRFDELSPMQKTFLTILAAVATATHYGNMPLMLGVGLFALGWRFAMRRLTLSATVAVLVAICFSPLTNLAASGLVLKTASLAPMRLPILLARSLQDGPARWYLESECPHSDFAFCEAFGNHIPGSISDFLWAEDGVRSLTPKMSARIRAEEPELLMQVFMKYPVEQTASLFANAGKQFLLVGIGEMENVAGVDEKYEMVPAANDTGKRMLGIFDKIAPIGVALAFAELLVLGFSGWIAGLDLRVGLTIAVGLMLNALIFGGLSAPVERYQARIAWLVPVFLVIVVAQTISQRRHVE